MPGQAPSPAALLPLVELGGGGSHEPRSRGKRKPLGSLPNGGGGGPSSASSSSAAAVVQPAHKKRRRAEAVLLGMQCGLAAPAAGDEARAAVVPRHGSGKKRSVGARSRPTPAKRAKGQEAVAAACSLSTGEARAVKSCLKGLVDSVVAAAEAEARRNEVAAAKAAKKAVESARQASERRFPQHARQHVFLQGSRR